jgi:enoyl-CoA hydratase/carnithine racemase
MSDRVSISINNGIADVRLSRPDKRNALDGEMFSAIAAAGESLKSEKDLRVVVLSGEGASFCAGLDFGSFQQMAGDGDGGNRQPRASDINEGAIAHLGQQACWVWQEVPVPVIAAVHGHALGGGIQVALGADIRIAHPDTQFSVRETYWGLVPDMTGSLMLSQLVRADVAKELVFTARIFDGREAKELGIVTSLSDNPREDAMALAQELTLRSPDALRNAKKLINGLIHERAAEQFAAERRFIGELIGSPNQVEAVMSHFEKRPPSFSA